MLAIKDRSKFLAVTGAVVLTALANGRASGDASHRVGSETGREIPRFVSIKASPANVRYGPSMKHDIKWTFARRSVPVEVLAEFDNWRRIRDSKGVARRTALVSPWRAASRVTLRSGPDASAPALALVQPNVLVRVTECDGNWCSISVRSFEGYVRQDRLWGVYPGERVTGAT